MDEPMTAVIGRRFSCRRYGERPIEADKRLLLADFLAVRPEGPFGTPVRLALAAATEEDRQALKGLGTYGFIRGATGFIIGAVRRGPRDMEDFGYVMEEAILYATALDLGTCWLGGSFTRSSFATKIAAGREETVPAVTAVGYRADGPEEWLRRTSGGRSRLPWEELFFAGGFGRPLTADEAGRYAVPLAMVRLAPSASNKQPWRVVAAGGRWHFYLLRTKGYGKGSLVYRLLGLADLQRVDLGIALCHFALTARELGLGGRWVREEPGIAPADGEAEYIASWVAE
jgi:nitroreductase